MAATLVTVAPDLEPIVGVTAIECAGVTVLARDPRMDGPLADAEARVRAVPPAERDAVRTMYKQIGLDPTKTRPSSEALLRRVRKGDAMPRINSLVDICNWCSLELQLPYGLYDLDRVSGSVELRMGRTGEEYEGIRKGPVHVGGRMLLADATGPFGNPTSDSARTMVTLETVRALFVVFVPRSLVRELSDRAWRLTAERVRAFGGGAVEVVGGPGGGPTT